MQGFMDEKQQDQGVQAVTQKQSYRTWIIIGVVVLALLYGVQSFFSPERMVERAIESASDENVNVDIGQDGSIEYTSEDGESVRLSAGEDVGIPDTWPRSVPNPDEITVSYAASTENTPGAMSHMINYATSKSASELTEHYTRVFSVNGWTIQSNVTMSGSILLAAEHADGDTAAVQIIDGTDERMVTVTVEESLE